MGSAIVVDKQGFIFWVVAYEKFDCVKSYLLCNVHQSKTIISVKPGHFFHNVKYLRLAICCLGW